MIITVLAFIFLLGIIVLVHEFGHFITAKMCGIYVHEFALGMGPTIYKKQGKETLYSIHLLPIGGFCAMAGEDVNSDDEKDKVIPAERMFCNKKYWQKIIVLLAGVAMNFILAISIFTIIVGLARAYFEPAQATVSSLMENYPAEKAGIEIGDKIIAIDINDKTFKISTFTDVQLMQSLIESEEVVTYTVVRDNETLKIAVTPIYDEESNSYIIGIYGNSDTKIDVKWYMAPYYGTRMTLDTFSLMIKSLAILFTPTGYKQLSGPIGVATVTGEVVSLGLFSYIILIALLSINVGFVNLLPLPVLDGGQVLLETIQVIFRKRISEKVKIIIMIISWLLLFALMIFVTINDVWKLFI